jgi:hypothetical protein
MKSGEVSTTRQHPVHQTRRTRGIIAEVELFSPFKLGLVEMQRERRFCQPVAELILSHAKCFPWSQQRSAILQVLLHRRNAVMARPIRRAVAARAERFMFDRLVFDRPVPAKWLELQLAGVRAEHEEGNAVDAATPARNVPARELPRGNSEVAAQRAATMRHKSAVCFFVSVLTTLRSRPGTFQRYLNRTANRSF